MKPIHLLFAALISFTACKKEDNSNNNNNNNNNPNTTYSEGYTTFKLNGVQKRYDYGEARIQTVDNTNFSLLASFTLARSGSPNEQLFINITQSGDISLSNYNLRAAKSRFLGWQDMTVAHIYGAGYTNVVNKGTGSITITKKVALSSGLEWAIAGTYEGDVIYDGDTLHITEGVFADRAAR